MESCRVEENVYALRKTCFRDKVVFLSTSVDIAPFPLGYMYAPPVGDVSSN